MIRLRQYQEQALQAETQHRIDHPDETRLAIVMATGLGKGTIIAERAWRFIQAELKATRLGGERELGTQYRALILAPTDEIVTDLAQRCRLVSGECTVGIVKAERDEHDADIVVASIQTLLDPVRRARIADVGLVLVDECEAYVAPQWRKVLEHYGCFPACACPETSLELCPKHGPRSDATPALGFTATLERGDGQGLGTVWQNVCFTRDISWGVRKGYLVQPIGHRLEIELEGKAKFGKAPGFSTDAGLMDSQLVDALAPEKIVEKWLELASDRQTVAFMPLVRSAVKLAEAFSGAGISAVVISGDMNPAERRWKIDQFKAGKIMVLVNAMVLTRGFDHPDISCVIIGRPTKSRGLFIQMAGRGLRPVPGVPVEEQDCLLITVADAATDLCTVADLSEKPLDRKLQGALTALEDQWDIGAGIADPERVWLGRVDAHEFDPLVRRSSKVWRTTKGGTLFLPYGKERQYVFLVGTSVFVRAGVICRRLHKDLPDLELALSVAEDEATERGGDIGALLADRTRAWRKGRPNEKTIEYATGLGLGAEVARIMADKAGGKAGKVSDLIARMEATRALDPIVATIKETAETQ